MVEVKNVEVYGLDRAICAIRNSFNAGEIDTTDWTGIRPIPIGMNEPTKTWRTACKLGTSDEPHQSHDSWLRGVIVQFDIKYPLYFSPEFQRYHFAEIIMSQSTMHSLEKMVAGEIDPYNKYVTEATKDEVEHLYRYWKLAKSKGNDEDEYEAFMELRPNLPCGFEMWMTVSTNYLQLKTIWIQRHNHKLQEDWQEGFCKNFIEKLPYFKELCLAKIQ